MCSFYMLYTVIHGNWLQCAVNAGRMTVRTVLCVVHPSSQQLITEHAGRHQHVTGD